MIKPVKRNKRLKWIDSHYANFYKAGLLWKRIQIAQISATAIYRIQAIRRAISKDKVGKVLATDNTVVAMVDAMSKIPAVKGRATK